MGVLGALLPSGLFGFAFMQNAWIAGTGAALLASLVGFFVVLRGEAFAAHAIPRASFAGAAGAVLAGGSTLLGLGAAAALSALAMTSLTLGRDRGQVTALVLMAALGLGSLFLSVGGDYAPKVYALLFGQIVGVSRQDALTILALLVVCILAVAAVFRPLLWSSVAPEMAEARGVRTRTMNLVFLLLVALASVAAVPVVGALLTFSLMVGPAAAAARLARGPAAVLAVSAGLALASIWLGLLLAFDTGLPVGFFVASLTSVFYGLARLGTSASRQLREHRPPRTPAGGGTP